MSKEIDIACEQEELLRETQIKAITNRNRGISAFSCSDCERPIPENRRAAYPGCSTCIDCQTISEIRARHYRSV